MKAKLSLLSLAFTAMSAVIAGPALALSMVAGWDFSQYSTDGFLSVDEATETGTLDSNYSDLDPDVGPTAAGFGTMYVDGSFGSTNSPLDFATNPFVPSAAAPGSLSSNLTVPAGSDFESLTLLLLNGQPFANPFSMTALAMAVSVFEADLGSVATTGSNWVISFAGKTNSGSSNVGIEFSTDGVSFSSFGSVSFTTVDTGFSVTLGTAASEKAYVRFGFSPDVEGLQQTFLDNVAFSADLATVPEPAAALLLLTGLIGLARAGRRRSA